MRDRGKIDYRIEYLIINIAKRSTAVYKIFNGARYSTGKGAGERIRMELTEVLPKRVRAIV